MLQGCETLKPLEKQVKKAKGNRVYTPSVNGRLNVKSTVDKKEVCLMHSCMESAEMPQGYNQIKGFPQAAGILSSVADTIFSNKSTLLLAQTKDFSVLSYSEHNRRKLPKLHTVHLTAVPCRINNESQKL